MPSRQNKVESGVEGFRAESQVLTVIGAHWGREGRRGKACQRPEHTFPWQSVGYCTIPTHAGGITEKANHVLVGKKRCLN